MCLRGTSGLLGHPGSCLGSATRNNDYKKSLTLTEHLLHPSHCSKDYKGRTHLTLMVTEGKQ